MHWRPAAAADASLLAALATATSADPVTPDEAAAFMRSWSVELATLGETGAAAAVAVLPPTPGHRRGHGAWWSRRGVDSEIISRLVGLATATPELQILRVSTGDPAEQVVLRAQGFDEGYPVWTMTHDNTTWPDGPPALPANLRSAGWADVSATAFYTTYEQAYRDQRLVEPHNAETLNQLVTDTAFAPDLSTFAVAPDGQVAGFVLACVNARNEVELGPIGTDPAHRGRGISSALLAATLTRCRTTRQAPITLTVDAQSPTGAHRLYLRRGFRITRHLDVQHLHLPPHGR
ncbi:GNAT family N-acetyltransferase [Kribbella sp. NPDC048928]|uniref:GNAT family N-acetyltransferase n=1 Tax=Kribbella sp. NPDC048928 TaxID=3364111 RepID=UPI00370FA87C